MSIIQLTKTNDNGVHVKYFTHTNYFNQSDLDNLHAVFNKADKYRTTLSVITGLAAYHLFNFVPAGKNIVLSKFTHKRAGSFLALGASALTYVISTFGVIRAINSEEKRVLSNNSHPGWYDRNRVVNPERVFFELDDTRNNEINILHSGLSASNAERLFPDLIIGQQPKRPVQPVAEHHH